MDEPQPQSGAPYKPAAPATPQVIVQQQASAFGRFGKLLLVLLGLAVLTIIGMAGAYRSYFSPPGGPQERYHSLSKEAEDKIAIITVSGTIMDDDDFVKKQIDRVSEDESVKAIVLRVDSPGGTVTGSDYLYHHMRELVREKEVPLVVSMGGICASGGYYIAMAVGDQEDAIFAEPTTWTGSIGVVIPHYNISGMLESWRVEDDSVASHWQKLMGSPTRQLSDERREEEKALFQELVDLSFARFRGIVLKGRPALADDEEKLEQATTGRIFTAQQAKELGLVDQIGFVEQAIERAAELAGLDPDDARCVEYTEPPPSLATLLSAKAATQPVMPSDLRGLLELATPRAYYIYTAFPSLLATPAR